MCVVEAIVHLCFRLAGIRAYLRPGLRRLESRLTAHVASDSAIRRTGTPSSAVACRIVLAE
jgi:hypothetical protein